MTSLLMPVSHPLVGSLWCCKSIFCQQVIKDMSCQFKVLLIILPVGQPCLWGNSECVGFVFKVLNRMINKNCPDLRTVWIRGLRLNLGLLFSLKPPQSVSCIRLAPCCCSDGLTACARLLLSIRKPHCGWSLASEHFIHIEACVVNIKIHLFSSVWQNISVYKVILKTHRLWHPSRSFSPTLLLHLKVLNM